MKYFLLTLLAWFVITRLLRFRVVVYKGYQSRQGFDGSYSRDAKNDGTLRVDKEPGKKSEKRGSIDGDYVDYEEV